MVSSQPAKKPVPVMPSAGELVYSPKELALVVLLELVKPMLPAAQVAVRQSVGGEPST
jgi:hypothetical protein